MGSTSSVVEINGNQYDAYSGQLIRAGKKTKEQVKYHTSRVIDGFVKNSAVKPLKKPSVIKSQTSQGSRVSKETIKKTSARKQPAKSAKALHQRTEKSRTLMRQAVSRPVAIAKRSIADGLSTIAGTSIKPAGKDRAARAQKVVKHAKVRRFGASEASEQTDTNSSAITSKQPPASAVKVSASGTLALTSSPAASLSHQRLERMLDRALTQANDYKEKAGRQGSIGIWRRMRRTPRWITAVVIALIIALLALFFALQSIPQIALKLASLRTHVNASLPAYTPSGFGYAGHVTSQGSQVVIPYQSSVNANQTYTVTEQPSSQDTSSMVANNTNSSQQVQTSQANGVPVVIVGDKGSASGAKAMCVNNGIQTTVSNLANLTPDELLNIAKSVCGN